MNEISTNSICEVPTFETCTEEMIENNTCVFFKSIHYIYVEKIP